MDPWVCVGVWLVDPRVCTSFRLLVIKRPKKNPSTDPTLTTSIHPSPSPPHYRSRPGGSKKRS